MKEILQQKTLDPKGEHLPRRSCSCARNLQTHLQPQESWHRENSLWKLCEIAEAVLDGKTGEMMEYCHLRISLRYRDVWGKLFGNEIGRLAKGMPGRVDGTNTLFFIYEEKIPQDRIKDVTYRRVVCDVWEVKKEEHRIQLTLGGDRINYTGDVSTPTACLLTVKLLLNSVISTEGSEFMTLDIIFFIWMHLWPNTNIFGKISQTTS